MSFRVITAADDAKEWQSVLDAMNYDIRDVHFMSGWGRVHETLYQDSKAMMAILETPEYIAAQPFLLRQNPCDITSMGYGGMFCNDLIPSRSHGLKFRQEFFEWQRRAGIVSAFTLYNPLFESEQFYLHHIMQHTEKRVVILPTAKPIDPAHGRLSDKQAAEEAGYRVAWEIGGSLGYFSRAYAAQMERVNAAARWRLPLAYFKAIEDNLRNDHAAHYALATVVDAGSTPVAMALFLLSPTAFYYHLATTVDGGRVRGASDMMIWAAHWIAAGNMASYLVLGGGVSDSPDDGVLAYKQSFGGITVPIYSTRSVVEVSAYRSASQEAGVQPLDWGGFFPAYRVKESQP